MNALKDNDTLFHNIDERQMFIFMLKQAGVTRIQVEFEGGGDSGQVGRVQILGEDAAEVDLYGHVMPVVHESQTFSEKDGWVAHQETATIPLADAVQTIVDEVIGNHVSWDWYNNEGGGGSFTIYLTADPVEFVLDGYYREVTHTDVASTRF